jgi:hypothetical protein
MGRIGRRIGKAQTSANDGTGFFGDSFFQDFFQRQGNIYNEPGAGPQGLSATGGIVSDYLDPGSGKIYRAHIFTSSGTFSVSALAPSPAIPNNVEYLVVAGGGGGGGVIGGGGGAGGFRTNLSGHPLASSSPFPVSTSPGAYTVTIGAGGAGTAAYINPQGPDSTSGNNTEFYLSTSSYPGSSFIRSVGGGGGGGGANRPGKSGGSGGGGNGGWGTPAGSGNSPSDPNHPQPQGQPGGSTPGTPGFYGGRGGNGSPISITGITTHYAGGGGGGSGVGYGGGGGGGATEAGSNAQPSVNSNAEVGGLGGGGYGGPSPSTTNGTYATGGGAGGGKDYFGNGGSGIVVVRYQIGSVQTGTARATGGAISYYGGKTIHTFTTSGTFATAPNWNAATVEYLVVGGGGGGGSTLNGGGGGAGGYLTGTTPIGAHPVSTSIQVGAGAAGGSISPSGPGGASGGDGTPSYFGTPITAYGGGGGGSSPPVGTAGRAGGSGGGGAGDRPATPNPGPSPYSPQQGFAGGSGGQGTYGPAGGGGGAGGAGSSGSGPAPDPLNSPVPGASLYYNGADLGYGGLGRQVPSTFRNSASRIGAPGPTGPVPVNNPGGDTSGLYWLAGGGGGASTDIRPTAAGGGVTVYTGSGYSYTATPYAGAGNGSPTQGDSALANTGSGGGGSDRWRYYSGSNYYFPGGNGGSGIVLIAYPS